MAPEEEQIAPTLQAEPQPAPVRVAAPVPQTQKSAAEPAPASAVPAFAVRNLAVYFGERQVLKNVSLDVAARAVTAIIGPSGCGKSTFLRALNRMHELNPEARMEGETPLFGEDVS